jgi:gamma-glutamyl-gamma-aminobutyrate hydrolase PuuD
MRVGVVIGRHPKERFSVHRGYVDALRALDAIPILVPAGGASDREVARDLLFDCAALIVTGGGDLHPAQYGADTEPDAELMETDCVRDDVDVWAVGEFHRAGRPVLGICRGAQTVAVAFGGALVQDLPAAGVAGHWDESRQCEPVHEIHVEPGSDASAALAGATTVNSIHHQAIATPGPMLRATAWGPGSEAFGPVIEAVETAGVLGVQWHPERLYFGGDAIHLAPFEWLVKRA